MNTTSVALPVPSVKSKKTPLNWRLVLLFAYAGLTFSLPLLKLTTNHPHSWWLALAPIWITLVLAILAVVVTIGVLIYEKWEQCWNSHEGT